MKLIYFLFAFLIFFTLAPFLKPALAVSVSITSFPSVITNESFTVTASVSGAQTGTNYLRVDLFKDGTSNYFGETNNGNSWYSGGDGTLYFPVSIDSSKNGSATFQARIGTPNSNDYLGSGSYKLRIRCYTGSGNQAQIDDQTPVDITINYSSPTQVRTSSPTLTPSPLPTPSKTPTPKPSPKTDLEGETKDDLTNPKDSPTPQEEVLSAKDTQENSGSSKSVQVAGYKSSNNLGYIFIIIGAIFLTLCGIVIFWSYKKSKANEISSN